MEQQLNPAIVASTTRTRRFFNLVIDNIIYEILMVLLVYPLIRLLFGTALLANFWISWFIALIFMFGYYFIFEALLQKTPGKFVTGTKVVMQDGTKPDMAVIAKRNLIRWIPFEIISMYTGNEADQKDTWWHDRWTATRVIKE